MTRRALITRTSSGIGLDTTILLAERGWQVVATLRNLAKREALDEAATAEGLSLEIRQLVAEALTSDAAHFRHVTSRFSEGFAKQMYVDTTDNGIIEIFQSRLRG